MSLVGSEVFVASGSSMDSDEWRLGAGGVGGGKTLVGREPMTPSSWEPALFSCVYYYSLALFYLHE